MNEEWNDNSEVSVKDLDALVVTMSDAKDVYEEAKRVSNEKHAAYDSLRRKVLIHLEQLNKKSYKVDGIGTVGVKTELKVRYPETLDERKKFFEWMQAQGEDLLLTKLTVNYQTLNSLYNEEFEKAAEEGRSAEFNIPGISEPASENTLTFRRR